MKTRCVVYVAGLVFLWAAQLSAAQPGAAVMPARTSAPALCAAGSSAPQLPIQGLLPLPPVFAAVECGSCSDSGCIGHNLGSPCVLAPFGKPGNYCYFNDNCSSGGMQCLCQPPV